MNKKEITYHKKVERATDAWVERVTAIISEAQSDRDRGLISRVVCDDLEHLVMIITSVRQQLTNL